MRYLVFMIVSSFVCISYAQNLVTYSYDTQNRLTSVIQPNGSTINYTYDELGNRMTYVITSVNTNADLTITDSLVSTTQVEAGNNINIQFKIRNNGVSNAGGHFTRIYLSELENQIGTEISSVFHNGIISDSMVEINETVTIPAVTMSGQYYIVIVADADELVLESDEENNIASLPLSIIEPINVYNLTISDMQLSEPNVNPEDTFEINANINNSGGVTTDTCFLQAYLSFNQSFEEYLDEVLPSTYLVVDPMISGGQFNYLMETNISANTINGDYYVLLVLSSYHEGILTIDDVVVEYLPVGQQPLVLQQRILQPGWNYVSFNVSPENKDIESVFATISGTLDESKNPIVTYLPPYEDILSTMNSISDGEGYLVNVDQECTLEIQGILIDRNISTISLSEGWNLVAFYGREPIAVDTALQSISNFLIQVKGQSGDYYHNDPGATNSLLNLLPGYGYFVKVNADVELIYNY